MGEHGELAATFLYATPGAEGLRQALKHLNGEEVPKAVVLDTMTVTKENADEILKANGLMWPAWPRCRRAAALAETSMDWLNSPPEWSEERGALTVATGDRTDFCARRAMASSATTGISATSRRRATSAPASRSAATTASSTIRPG